MNRLAIAQHLDTMSRHIRDGVRCARSGRVADGMRMIDSGLATAKWLENALRDAEKNGEQQGEG